MQQIVKVFLCLQLIFSPVLGAARPLTEPEKANRADRLRAAIFENLAANSWAVQSTDDFAKTFLAGLSVRDRNDVLSFMPTSKSLPRLISHGDKLETASGPKISLTWPKLYQETFFINKVAWTYNPNGPLKAQVLRLQKELNGKKSAGFVVPNLIFPEAEADGGLTTAVIMIFIGMIIGNYGQDLFDGPYCTIVQFFDGKTQRCINFEKAKREAAKGTPPSDEVVNMAGSDTRNVLARFEGVDFACPSHSDGKERIYRGRFRTVESREGKKVATSDWKQILRKYSADGRPSDLIVTQGDGDPTKLDPSSAQGASKLIVHVAFDPVTRQPISFRIPNPNRANFLSSNTINLSENMNLSPEQRDIIDNALDIYKHSIFRVYNCVAQEVAAQQQAGIESGSPTAPKPANAPPATTN